MRRNNRQKFIIIIVPLFLLALLVVFLHPYATTPVSKNSTKPSNADLPLDKIRMPAGFSISVYASNVSDAREMALSPNGTLYVGTRYAGKVYAIPDADKDGNADAVITIASGLHMPAGVEFRNGSLYVAEVERVSKYDDMDSRLNNVPTPEVIVSGFPNTSQHAWKHIRFGPDGRLYIPVGASEDLIDTPGQPWLASIMRINQDGSSEDIYARGVRNTLGLDWDPVTGYLWFVENGHNSLNDSGPPDELDSAPHAGMHFGYPYVCGNNYTDPLYGQGINISNFTPPELELEPHVAPLGIRFYNGDMFPAEYRGQIFVSEHGSMEPFTPVGYRIELVTLSESRKATGHRVFADGWLQNGKAWGRPVDLLVMPDGSMLVSDDKAGVIYRIMYNPSVGGG
ncbi:MAG TPA: PQQ-dependent sugar dehydrogenase [Methanocella sp.]|nr:PQQ-dependent sugar dehydrogenase [Methanocella sp.]